MCRLFKAIFLLIALSLVQGCETYRTIMCISGIGVTPWDEEIRPTGFEWSYYGISEDIGNADLCYKMSSKAFLTTGLLAPGGASIDYTRSKCFYNVALKTKNKQFCHNAIPFKSYGCFNGDDFSEKKCLNAIETNENSNGPSPDAELIMRYLEYNDHDVENYKDDRMINKKLMMHDAFFELYLDERNTEKFKNKLMMLPDFSISNAVAIDQIHSKYPQCTPENFDDRLCVRINCALYWQGRENPRCNY